MKIWVLQQWDCGWEPICAFKSEAAAIAAGDLMVKEAGIILEEDDDENGWTDFLCLEEIELVD